MGAGATSRAYAAVATNPPQAISPNAQPTYAMKVVRPLAQIPPGVLQHEYLIVLSIREKIANSGVANVANLLYMLPNPIGLTAFRFNQYHTLVSTPVGCHLEYISQLVGIIPSLVQLLKAVHNAGFIHRDLRLDNIFVHRLGDTSPLLNDWGFAAEIRKVVYNASGALAYCAPHILLAAISNISYTTAAADDLCQFLRYCFLHKANNNKGFSNGTPLANVLTVWERVTQSNEWVSSGAKAAEEAALRAEGPDYEVYAEKLVQVLGTKLTSVDIPSQ